MGDQTQFCMPRVREKKNKKNRDTLTRIRLPGADSGCSREMRPGIARLQGIGRPGQYNSGAVIGVRAQLCEGRIPATL